MNFKRFIYLKKVNIAKFLVVSCVFLLACLFSTVKVDALNEVTIIGSTYTGNGNKTEAKTINDIVYIQGSGVSNNDGITFEIKNMYESLDDFTAFGIWEQGYSETSELNDYDRWYVRSITCSDATTCPEWDEEVEKVGDLMARNINQQGTPIIYHQVSFVRYYIEASASNANKGNVTTVVDFSKFFTDATVTYTYRIRNLNYHLYQDGFGFKEIYLNYWKANDGSINPDNAIYVEPIKIKYGLARAIDDVDAYTNHDEQPTNNSLINCSVHPNDICVDYADTDGDPTASTTISRFTNIYLPKNVIYNHASTTRIQVNNNLTDDDKVDLDYVRENNTLYAYNYFCEGDSIAIAGISWSDGKHSAACNSGTLRQYLYVQATLENSDIDSVDTFVNQQRYFTEATYKISIEVDSRGNYVLMIRDVFGNVNEVTVFKVMDIINQALIAYFDKSNHTSEDYEVADGWKANEYLTNQDVEVIITMSATTVIEKGLPIIEAETTLLDSSYIKEIRYWRVDVKSILQDKGSDTDVCEEGQKTGCAEKPADTTVLYSKPRDAQTATTHDAFIKFEANSIYLKISSNGRYRFYIETYPGNNTNTNEGEKRNPRVEVYKIDKEKPQILFGGNTDSYCNEGVCSYTEETFKYYQGTGNTSGTVVNSLVSSANKENEEFVIGYSKNGIYYVSANDQDPIYFTASNIADEIYTYMYALYNSNAYFREVISYYDGTFTQYDHFNATGNQTGNVKYKLDFDTLSGLTEEQYRNYIISSDIKYTAYSLASNPEFIKDDEDDTVFVDQKDVSAIEIEYYDATDTNSLVCSKVTIDDLTGDNKVDENDCVNYYLDHGLNFKIKITIYDIVQDENGKYILGNANLPKFITVNVKDTTAPGFSSEIRKYNVGTDCRIEVGSGVGSKDNVLGCYSIKSGSIYNFEDNVFNPSTPYVYSQSINNANYVDLYMLGKDGEWHNLSSSYVPNRSGDYAILIVIRDAASTTTTFNVSGNVYHDITVSDNITVNGNAIATIISYKVDKRIVIITPEGGNKTYGEADPGYFEFSVSINGSTSGVADYLEAPFADMDVFNVTVETTNGALSEEDNKEIFTVNDDYAGFKGNLTRQESAQYNDYHSSATANNYVGVYKVVLGSLNITCVADECGDYADIGNDYIIKIDPRVRNDEYQLSTIDRTYRINGEKKCNLVNSQIVEDAEGNDKAVTGCYSFTEDDDFFVESNVIFEIRQAILTVTATGASKVYGASDPNYTNFNGNTTYSTITGTDAYLKGYSISGLKNDNDQYKDTASVVLGVLRREVGEHVGIYAICNYRGTGYADNSLEETNNMLVVGSVTNVSGVTCSNEGLDEYASTTINANGTYVNGILELEEEYIKSRALYIATNKRVGLLKTLNSLEASGDARNNNYANYVINYVENTFEITPATLIVQPTPGQRREYTYSGVDEVNPWEIVVYNEQEAKIKVADEGFNGYTQSLSSYTANANDSQSVDLGSPSTGTEHYNNATENRTGTDGWVLVRDGITYKNGKKTNVTYTLFEGSISLKDWIAEDGVFKDMNAGWYSFNEIADSTLGVVVNGRKQCTYSNYVTSVGIESTGDCRNYDLILDLDYRNDEGYKNGDTVDGETVTVVYKSKDKYCRTTTLGDVSDPDVMCTTEQSSEILFEVYRREIILEFNSLLEKITVNGDEIDLVYGYRYNYYKTNLLTVDESNNDTVEGSLFYCYAAYSDGLVDLGQGENCTNNKWIGLTDGDTWYNVGLEFHLHKLISAENSGYYADTDSAIPAGRYYMYASIQKTNNYKFNYLGGTFTIKTKSMATELTSYSKVYGNVYYDDVTCLKDGSFLNGEGLITDCSDVSNSTSNTYGFVITNLDSKDTIADNFTGRPKRVTDLVGTNLANGDKNGLQENVGVYAINVGSIHSKNNNKFLTTNACNDNFKADETTCVVVSDVSINNYIISNDNVDDFALTYYLYKNGTEANEKDYSSSALTSVVNSDDRTINTASLTITPASITITVTGSQTKMYGCAYNQVNTTSSYSYSYSEGYNCIESNGNNYDFGYEYTVTGDRDYHIYNNGYYDDNYSAETTYTISAINTDLSKQAHTGLRSTALNSGVLYRINKDKYSEGISYNDLVSAANNAQNRTHVQGQNVGTYIITLGNLNAELASKLSNYNSTHNNVCNASNEPGKGSLVCRNYIINYYGNTSIDETHEYDISEDEELKFTITTRVAFIYTKYNSKVYGNDDPLMTRVCDMDMVALGLCSNEELDETISYGVSYYYTKYNSLAKAPWVASVVEDEDNVISFASVDSRNDVQTDVTEGALSRRGMGNNTKTKDDIVDTYHYLFEGHVSTTDYADNNYKLNYYYRTLVDSKITVKDGDVDNTTNTLILDAQKGQEQAVNENGGITEVVGEETKNVIFEINLRKITVTLISFSKVYGIEDSSKYYDLGVCATGDQYLTYDEKGNPKCAFNEGKDSTEHGLSPTHMASYIDGDGLLLQASFKTAFGVTYLRALGENVTCSNTLKVSGTLTGYFPNKATEYEYDLGCNGTGYESIGVIDQSSKDKLGYNYEITYVEGIMSVIPRTIEITPDSNQGFQYGSYTSPSLIPAITFTNSLVNYGYKVSGQKVVAYSLTSGVATIKIVNRDESVTTSEDTTNSLGLVNAGANKICLTNIDQDNSFCINDRQNTYKIGDDETTTDTYSANVTGLTSVVTYVFGDMYLNEESTRSALNRSISTFLDERYNRNVGTYTITKGDLEDKSGNYTITFKEGVEYKITPADLKITPDSGQNKIYGQSDKELTFKVVTTYKVNNDQYVTYDESIAKIVDSEDNEIEITGTKIKVTAGSTITLNGYAYYENNSNSSYNYGLVKVSNKSGYVAEADAISQSGITGKSFDKYCYDNYSNNSTAAIGAIEGCSEQNVTASTSRAILIGYLYVENYTQIAGTHKIVNGLVVTLNEFGGTNKNYSLNFVSDVEFVINQLDINLSINNITKVYGQATDTYKCETGADCSSNFAALDAQDNENMLEYNFDVSYKDEDEVIPQATYNGIIKVLLVHSINNNYYTQSEGEEDKNNFLGVSVIRKNNNDTTCSIDSDPFGCEDVGTYKLVFRKVSVTNDYDKNYNLMYDNSDVTTSEVDNDYIVVKPSDHKVEELEKVTIINEIEGTITINKRAIDIFVNTNLNVSSANYYEIEQNIEVPSLPTINNVYNLIGYRYDKNKEYHGLGENASSSSSNTDLDSTYTKIVWGNRPGQVRVNDALVGAVAYCNQPSNGNLYSANYPEANTLCSTGELVYQADKNKVNTNTKDKFIFITRDVSSAQGLKIMSSASSSGVDNNNYENKNYTVTFYPGAVHVIGDSSNPTLVVGNKDYYIEANAKKDGENIVGSTSSVGTILEYLFNGTDTYYILANVDSDGNLYITIDTEKVVITESSLVNKYGIGNESYPGIVSGTEQTLVYPFISDFAHTSNPGNTSYLNEDNITKLEELVTTFIKWFDVTSYDNGQIINGEYLTRKFDKYYYIAINKNGYDIANNIGNSFAINKVGSYDVRFYVMDNAGRISDDGNVGTLHVIDTTAPVLGELTLFNTEVKCDVECNTLDKWYVSDSKIRLASFNRYSVRQDADGNDVYYLDSAGEYIYYTEIGNDTSPYKKITDLESGENPVITIENNTKYVEITSKISAMGVIHYIWNGNPEGIYLNITGGADNSYTVEGDSEASQWGYYYSLDNGTYWITYEMKDAMVSYSALTTDGKRTIKARTLDTGVNKSEVNTTYSISYQVCYEDCKDIEILNKVDIDGTIYEISENDINNKYFDLNSTTRCEINSVGTLLTCITKNPGSEDIKNTYKIEGNKVTISSNNYLIYGDYLLSSSGDYAATINKKYVEIEGKHYEYDEHTMLLTLTHKGYLTDPDAEGKITMILDGEVYTIVGSEILTSSGVNIATIDNYSFEIGGLTYNYISTPAEGEQYILDDTTYVLNGDYYLASEEYELYQDTFKVDGVTYNISGFVNNLFNISRDILTLHKSTNYTTTYKLADKYLISLTEEYFEIGEDDVADLVFRNRVINSVGWNVASLDAGSANSEISGYIYENPAANIKYYKDSKIAYLDTTAPIIGTRMTTVIDNETVVVRYGEDWYVHEYGYYNTMDLTLTKQYTLAGITYTISIDTEDMNNSKVTTSDSKTYSIKASGLGDVSMTYVYQINYTNYYIDNDVTKIKWLRGYVERFVGTKDQVKGKAVNEDEAKYYALNNSVFLSAQEISVEDTSSHIVSISNNTNINLASGISGNKYAGDGLSETLFDFIHLGEYQNGIYYDDIDYIVHYTDANDEAVSVNLNEEFKACYEAKGKITQDCAQEAIATVIKAPSKDTVYTINYVARDKAGNSSSYAARGVLFASILPTTNVVINNIAASPVNSEIVVEDLGNNTYSLRANQGVSLQLLEEAFSVNYGSYYKNYNDAAVMTIYNENEIIANEVSGVAFTQYINSDEIGNYTIVYKMNSAYTTYLGENIKLEGDTITLKVSILSPVVKDDSSVTIDSVAKNESSLILLILILGLISITGLMAVYFIRKKKH